MPQAPRRLGRGLSSILSISDESPLPASPADSASSSPPEQPSLLKVEQLRPNPFQPRRDMGPAELKTLADSIARTGIIQPIAVRKVGDGLYEIIAGERRWRAAQMAGLTTIPVYIREANDEEVLEIALVENIFREDLNAIDRALAYKRYCDEFNLNAEEVGGRLGEDRTTVVNYLRLLDLPNEVKEWVASGELAMGHARCLLGLRAPTEMIAVARESLEKELSVRAVERLVRERLAARSEAAKEKAPRQEKRPVIRDMEQAFVRTLGCKVEISESKRKGRGKVVIHYGSLEDFDRIAAKLDVHVE